MPACKWPRGYGSRAAEMLPSTWAATTTGCGRGERWNVTDRIAIVARMVLALLLLVAGGAKIADPVGFAAILAGTGFVPVPAIAPLAILLPWIEVTAGAALAFMPAF